MENEGLKNFCLNISPIMKKLKENQKLTISENQTLVQFYLEVIANLN